MAGSEIIIKLVSTTPSDVDDIAKQIKLSAVMLYGIEPGNNSFFALQAVFIVWHAEMEVGSKVNFFIS